MLQSRENSFGKYIPLKSIKNHMSLQSLFFFLISLQIITGAIVISFGFNGKPWAPGLGIKMEMDFSSLICCWHWPRDTNNLQSTDCCCLVRHALRINFSLGYSFRIPNIGSTMTVTFYFSLKYKFEKGNGWWNSIKNQWWFNVIKGEAANIRQLPLISITTLINKTKFILLAPFCWQVFTDISKWLFRSACAHAQ